MVLSSGRALVGLCERLAAELSAAARVLAPVVVLDGRWRHSCPPGFFALGIS